jgi:hypothetical protein
MNIQGELLVSKGMLRRPLSIDRRHASTLIFSETAGQIYFKFGVYSLVTVTIKFAHMVSIGPF